MNILTFRVPQPGAIECVLALDLLYPTMEQRQGFEENWNEFLKIDPNHPSFFCRENNQLIYTSEEFVPGQSDGRPAVLLVFGNPATHSVVNGLCFAFEGNGHEHRFWVAQRETGMLTFPKEVDKEGCSWQEINRLRKEALFNLDYQSPFRVGIAMFYTFPTPASAPKWAGVGGLYKLFGKRALKLIEIEEKQRLGRLIQGFLGGGDAMICFQKDAYEGLRPQPAPAYSLLEAKAGKLSYLPETGNGIKFFGAPPTRYAYSKGFRNLLVDIMRPFIVEAHT